MGHIVESGASPPPPTRTVAIATTTTDVSGSASSLLDVMIVPMQFVLQFKYVQHWFSTLSEEECEDEQESGQDFVRCVGNTQLGKHDYEYYCIPHCADYDDV